VPFGEFGEISWKLLTRKSRLPNCKVSHPHLMHKTSLVWYHWRWYTDGFRTSSVIVRKGLLLRVFHPMLHQWFLESHKGPYLAHAFSCFTMTLLLASPLLDCLQMTLLAIKNDQDAQSLQHDLDLLCEWEARWLMEFHPDKCEVISVTRKHPTLHRSVL